MKITRLLFLMIGCAGLTPGTNYGHPSGQASQQTTPKTAASALSDHPHAVLIGAGKRQKEKSSSNERRHLLHPSVQNHPHSYATTPTNRSKQLSKSAGRFPAGKGTNLHQAGLGKSGGVAKSGVIRQEADVIRPTIPNNVRHGGPNAAVIGGSAKSIGGNTGAIDGTRVRRRP